MEIDGWYMLYYDKMTREKTNMFVDLSSLFASDYAQIYNGEAIKEINNFGKKYIIPSDLDVHFYQVIMFSDKNNNKYTVIGINIKLLREYVVASKQIPNENFIISVCKYHILNKINMNSTDDPNISENSRIEKISNEIETTVLSKVGDITDAMIENPSSINIDLYPYQKRSIKWMLNKELEYKTVNKNLAEEIMIGDIFFDAFREVFTMGNEETKIQFRGGALIDEVGLGKTIQMTTLSLLNPLNDVKYIRKGFNKFCGRATLIVSPNQLCGQWKRELENRISSKYNVNVIQILTKLHLDKYTYQDLLDADFVIISYFLFNNQAFLAKF